MVVEDGSTNVEGSQRSAGTSRVQFVTVTGDRSDYLLQGGCKSLTVKGDLLTVQAEIAPGAKITITGRGSIVSWDVASHGHGPASFVHGLGSRVQPVLAEPVVGGVVRREQEQKRHAESH